MQNKVIRTAILLSRVITWLVISMLLLLLSFVVYWHISPEALSNWHLIDPFRAGPATFYLQRSPMSNGWTLDELGSGMIYWLVLRMVIYAFLVLRSIRLVQRILHSVNGAGTFLASNIKHFRGLALLGVYFVIIGAFNFGTVQGQSFLNFSIPFGAILFSASCYVMAEIFKEGNHLLEDANSII